MPGPALVVMALTTALTRMPCPAVPCVSDKLSDPADWQNDLFHLFVSRALPNNPSPANPEMNSHTAAGIGTRLA